jgi:hypothetical protein
LKFNLFLPEIAVLVLSTFAFYHGHSMAQETFWLTHISAPYKTPKDMFPYLENPADNTGDVAVITLKDNRIAFNGDMCNYEIEKIKPFYINRVLADTIDESGGEKKFQQFLQFKLKMKSALSSWKQVYFVKRTYVPNDARACQLLQSSSMFRAGPEVILWDTTYFYRFQLGKEFKF